MQPITLNGKQALVIDVPEDEIADFNEKKEEAKKDFNLACDLYRSFVGKAETREERMRRINIFRAG